MMRKPSVYVSRKLPDPVLELLRPHANLTVFAREDEAVSRAELLRAVRGMDGILSMLTDAVGEELFEAAGPQLRIVANMAVGFDNIDVQAATRRGIFVTNTPDVLTETTADLTFGLLLSAARRIPEAERAVRAGLWQTWSPLYLAGQDVYGKTLGIIGMGRIGEAVARRARGFDMNVIYCNRTRKPAVEQAEGYAFVEMDDLLQTSDFVVLLVPLTEQTRNLVGRRELGLMKPTAVLVNTARGPVLDEVALIEALQSRQIWAAGLDVFAEEPLPSDHPLTTMDNVVLLPHIGSASIDTRIRMGQLAAQNVLSVLCGQTPPNLVNPSVDAGFQQQ